MSSSRTEVPEVPSVDRVFLYPTHKRDIQAQHIFHIFTSNGIIPRIKICPELQTVQVAAFIGASEVYWEGVDADLMQYVLKNYQPSVIDAE